MKTEIICFTEKGSKICSNLVTELKCRGYECNGYVKSKYLRENQASLQNSVLDSLVYVEVNLDKWTGEMFKKADAIIFIGACGIAVRAIAPYIVHKGKDPAVVVIDEKGNYAISLLSGHIGGANELTNLVSAIIGATPVITTATDINNRFSVDTFAAKEKLFLSNYQLAKDISALIVHGGEVELYSDFPVSTELAEGLSFKTEYDSRRTEQPCIYITIKDKIIDCTNTLVLIPKVVVLGVGCKKYTPTEIIESRIINILAENNISLKAVSHVGSIDLKAEEKGILDFTNKYNLEYITYSAEQLMRVEGVFQSSTFVEKTTGVDNVCERAAVLASNYGKLIVPKFGKDGVTTAVAIKEWSVKFE